MMKNGVNFARKVLMNDECSLLILDELLGVIDNGVVTREEVEALFKTFEEMALWKPLIQRGRVRSNR